MACRNACLNAIAYLEKFGYSGAQAYLLLGAAPIEGRVSGVVDIRPSASGPITADRGSCAISS